MNCPAKWKLITGFALAFALATTFSCTWKRPARDVLWKDEARALRGWVKASGREYQCYFVTITGSGVPEDFGAGDLGTRDPKCMGLGINSPTVSLETIEKVGIKFRIPGGPKRRVRVIGVGTAAGDCSGQTVKQLFERRPSLYELGVAEEDTFVDKRIVVRASATVDSPSDLVKPCDSPDKPVPDVPKDLKVAALIYQGGTYTVRLFSRDADLRLVKERDIVVTGFAPQFLVAPPDFRSFYAYQIGSGELRVQRFNIDAQNNIVTSSDANTGYYQHLLFRSESLEFSNLSNAAYVRSWDRFYTYQIGDISWTPSPVSFLCMVNNFRLFGLGSHVYRFGAGTLDWIVPDANGNICTDVAGGTSPNGNALEIHRSRIGNFYVLGESTNTLSVQGYLPASGTILTPLSGQVSFLGNVFGSMALVGDHHLLVTDGSQDAIRRYRIADGGAIVGDAFTLNGGIIAATGLQADPFGKSVFAIVSTGELIQYKVDDNGVLTRHVGEEIENAGDYQKVLAIPLY